nr:lipoxygenase homology domain-containing protein 1-like [Anolis sagrei ordinatus]
MLELVQMRLTEMVKNLEIMPYEECVLIYGDKGKSDEMKLDNKSDNFEAGQTDKFMIELPDLGILYKIRIWHEKRSPFAGWHLDKVTLLKTLTKEKYTFRCGRWLDSSEDDFEIGRELTAEGPLVTEVMPVIKYRVTVHTGNVSGSGTDAHVFACLIGDQGDTGDRVLQNSVNTVNKFEKASRKSQMTEPSAEAPAFFAHWGGLLLDACVMGSCEI